MASSKFGMASGIPERRVRPIWDAIDTRQFKNALKLSVSLLTKFPNSPYALVLPHVMKIEEDEADRKSLEGRGPSYQA